MEAPRGPQAPARKRKGPGAARDGSPARKRPVPLPPPRPPGEAIEVRRPFFAYPLPAFDREAEARLREQWRLEALERAANPQLAKRRAAPRPRAPRQATGQPAAAAPRRQRQQKAAPRGRAAGVGAAAAGPRRATRPRAAPAAAPAALAAKKKKKAKRTSRKRLHVSGLARMLRTGRERPALQRLLRLLRRRARALRAARSDPARKHKKSKPTKKKKKKAGPPLATPALLRALLALLCAGLRVAPASAFPLRAEPLGKKKKKKQPKKKKKKSGKQKPAVAPKQAKQAPGRRGAAPPQAGPRHAVRPVPPPRREPPPASNEPPRRPCFPTPIPPLPPPEVIAAAMAAAAAAARSKPARPRPALRRVPAPLAPEPAWATPQPLAARLRERKRVSYREPVDDGGGGSDGEGRDCDPDASSAEEEDASSASESSDATLSDDDGAEGGGRGGRDGGGRGGRSGRRPRRVLRLRGGAAHLASPEPEPHSSDEADAAIECAPPPPEPEAPPADAAAAPSQQQDAAAAPTAAPEPELAPMEVDRPETLAAAGVEAVPVPEPAADAAAPLAADRPAAGGDPAAAPAPPASPTAAAPPKSKPPKSVPWLLRPEAPAGASGQHRALMLWAKRGAVGGTGTPAGPLAAPATEAPAAPTPAPAPAPAAAAPVAAGEPTAPADDASAAAPMVIDSGQAPAPPPLASMPAPPAPALPPAKPPRRSPPAPVGPPGYGLRGTLPSVSAGLAALQALRSMARLRDEALRMAAHPTGLGVLAACARLAHGGGSPEVGASAAAPAAPAAPGGPSDAARMDVDETTGGICDGLPVPPAAYRPLPPHLTALAASMAGETLALLLRRAAAGRGAARAAAIASADGSGGSKTAARARRLQAVADPSSAWAQLGVIDLLIDRLAIRIPADRLRSGGSTAAARLRPQRAAERAAAARALGALAASPDGRVRALALDRAGVALPALSALLLPGKAERDDGSVPDAGRTEGACPAFDAAAIVVSTAAAEALGDFLSAGAGAQLAEAPGAVPRLILLAAARRYCPLCPAARAAAAALWVLARLGDGIGPAAAAAAAVTTAASGPQVAAAAAATPGGEAEGPQAAADLPPAFSSPHRRVALRMRLAGSCGGRLVLKLHILGLGDADAGADGAADAAGGDSCEGGDCHHAPDANAVDPGPPRADRDHDSEQRGADPAATVKAAAAGVKSPPRPRLTEADMALRGLAALLPWRLLLGGPAAAAPPRGPRSSRPSGGNDVPCRTGSCSDGPGDVCACAGGKIAWRRMAGSLAAILGPDAAYAGKLGEGEEEGEPSLGGF